MKNILLIAACLFSLTVSSDAQIYRVAQMNTEQIRGLDKEKTVVILTGGILEEHGPHLPSFTDGYSNEWLAQKLAEAIVERKGMSVLIFPTVPLGNGGANEIGGKPVFPGSYGVRTTTLRAVFMDTATVLGDQGFRRIFVVHGHGAPLHNHTLDEAGEYFRDTYNGTMVHLRGLVPTGEQMAMLKLARPDLGLSDADKKEIGNFDEHAGFEETSRLMFVRPDLVDPIVRTLPPITINDPAGLFRIADIPDWAGYLSSPRLANASYGARLMQYRAARDTALAISILDGVLNERDIPRFGQMMIGNKQMAAAHAAIERIEAERGRKQLEWLAKKGLK